jgi:hypothetical protein
MLSTDQPFKPEPSLHPISTEILRIEGSNLIELSSDPLVVYDTECVAVVSRMKSRETSLVSTKVFSWHGKDWSRNKEEERKLNGLKTRYGCSVVSFHFISSMLHLSVS